MGVDGIVHAVRVWFRAIGRIMSVPILWARRLFWMPLIERSIPKFLYVSSPSVAHAGTALIGEGNGAASPEHARGNYARSKATAELAVLAANGTKLASGSTMRVGALRPHLIWGPGDTQLVERILDRAQSGRLPCFPGAQV